MLVVAFAGEVLKYANYHHGETSLHKAIISMTRDF